MGQTSLPTKTDASIGRVKTDRVPATSLATQVPAAEYERLKTAVIDCATEVGVHAGAAGDLNTRVNALETGTAAIDELAVIAPTTPGAAVGFSGNQVAGAREVKNILSNPAGEPADLSGGPYYLHLDDGSGGTEDVIVYARSGSTRLITSALSRDYSAGSATVAYAGPATSPAVAGLQPATDKVRLDELLDHALLVDDAGALTDNLDVGGNDITNVGVVDGRDLSADGAKLDGIEAGADVTDATNVAAAGAVMDSDFAGSATGTLTRTGTATYAVRKDNLAAAAPPTATDDSSAGYSVGSRWIVPGAGELVCLDATVGAAVWVPTAIAEESVATRSVSADATLTHDDRVVFVDTSAGAVTLTAPDPTQNYVPILIKKTSTDANAINIATPTGSIDGAASPQALPDSTSTARPSWTLCSDGVNTWSA